MVDIEISDAFAGLWKIGAGVALIMGFGAWVRPHAATMTTRTDQRSYALDTVMHAVAVPVRYEISRGNVNLRGCPRAPVVMIQREANGDWADQPSVNRYCDGAAVPRVRVTEGEPGSTVILLTAAGRYRAAVPWGNNWSWSQPFTVR